MRNLLVACLNKADLPTDDGLRATLAGISAAGYPTLEESERLFAADRQKLSEWR